MENVTYIVASDLFPTLILGNSVLSYFPFRTQRYHAAALTDEEFALTYATFCDMWAQPDAGNSLLKQLLDSYRERPIDFLSIGAGTGFFEKSLIEDLGLSVNFFYGIEPNDVHRKKLESTITELHLRSYEIDGRYFSKEIDLGRKFDFIFVSHVLYHIECPKDFMIHALAHLKPGGKLIIINIGELGVAALSKFFQKLVDVPHITDNSFTYHDLSNVLTALRIKHKIHQVPNICHDFTEFINKGNNESSNDPITFCLYTRYEKLPSEIQEEVYDFVKGKCFVNEEGRWMFTSDEGVIEVSQEENVTE